MQRLARVNRSVVFLAAAAYVFAALFIPGIVGAAMLLVLAGALMFLLLRTWPVHTSSNRASRLLVLGLMIVVAIVKVTR
jgi:Family of unknown function (DUF6703)